MAKLKFNLVAAKLCCQEGHAAERGQDGAASAHRTHHLAGPASWKPGAEPIVTDGLVAERTMIGTAELVRDEPVGY
jgi:hypothetical protein